MSSTRESMRRELKELAKLADTMRKDREPDPRSSGEWSALEVPSEESVSSVQETAGPPPLPRPSNTTVPPIASSYAPVFGVPEVEAAAPKRKRGVTIALVVGACVALGLVATGKVGRSLWKAPAAAAAQTTAVEAVAPVNSPVNPVAPATPPVPDPVVAAPPAEAAPQVLQANVPAPAAAPAPAPAHRRVQHATAKPPSAAAAAPKKAAGPAPAGGQSLDDLIRQAVAKPSK